MNALGHASNPPGLVLLISGVGGVLWPEGYFLKDQIMLYTVSNPSGVSHFTWKKTQSALLTSKAITEAWRAAGHVVPKSQT